MYRILLVEDDSGIAQAICEQGAMWELDVRCVRNFHDVLGEFTAYDPQLVLGSMTARDRADVLIALETGSSGAIGLYSVIAY